MCILRSSRIANSTIRRPKEILVGFINVFLLLGDSRFDLPVADKRTGSWVNPHFYRLRKETVRDD